NHPMAVRVNCLWIFTPVLGRYRGYPPKAEYACMRCVRVGAAHASAWRRASGVTRRRRNTPACDASEWVLRTLPPGGGPLGLPAEGGIRLHAMRPSGCCARFRLAAGLWGYPPKAEYACMRCVRVG